MQFLGKLTKQTWENGKKTPNFRPDFGLLGRNLCPKNIFAGFTFTSSPSSDPLQFKGRLMNQTEEIDKKPNFGPDFGWPKFDRPNFFSWVLPILVLDIVVSYHCMRFQEKLMNKIWENGKKKPSAGLYFDPNSGRHFFFFQKSGSVSLQDIMVSHRYYNIKIIIIITATTATTTTIIIIIKIIL